MALFAHIETGAALDPIERDTEAAYRALFADAVTAGWTVVEVPAGTKHGAKPNGDGTYTNPSVIVVTTPVVFDKADFKQYCYGKLGATLPEGLARYGAIIKACRASNVDAVVASFDQYEDAQGYRKDRAALFLTTLVGASIITQTEYDAIINGWPEQ